MALKRLLTICLSGRKRLLPRYPKTAGRCGTTGRRLERCGAIIHHLTPENHDTVFATVSHMPHLLAYGLVDYVANHPKSDLFFQYAASGFRDFTRIAGSSPEMWRDITLANRKQLLVELDAYLKEIELIRDLVDKADGCGLEKIYTNAQEARMNWLNAIENPEKKKMN